MSAEVSGIVGGSRLVASIRRRVSPETRSRVSRWLRRVGLQPASLGAVEPEFAALYERCRPYTMTSPERCYALYQAVRYVRAHSIEGTFVECGVWRGGSSMLACLAAASAGWEADFWLFDTFAGMTAPDDADGAAAVARWRGGAHGDRNDWAYAPEGEVRGNLLLTGVAPERLHLVRGPVEETIPSSSPERIALLRLDTDWYRSTLHELTHLYPRLASGGVLIIDDYGYWQGARRAVDEYFGAMPAPPMLTRIDVTGRIALKP